MSRVLLKLSGEALGGSQGFGFDSKILHFLSLEISKLIAVGHSVGLVLGGGNLVRGSGFAELSDDRVVGDHMGMLATIMNALALSSFLNRNQVVNKVFSALRFNSFKISAIFKFLSLQLILTDAKSLILRIIFLFFLKTFNAFFS